MRIISAIIVLSLLVSCSPRQQVIVPLSETILLEDTPTIIWYGASKAFRYMDGNWEADPRYDYVFNVVQKRYATTWKSTKSLHRNHPDYDGKAGSRSQHMYFEINFQAQKDSLLINLASSLGKGEGSSDKAYREQQLDFAVENVSNMAPYNRIRITQHYKYKEGLLKELVYLYKLKDGKEIPFMKNEEKAHFYTKGNLPQAPFTK